MKYDVGQLIHKKLIIIVISLMRNPDLKMSKVIFHFSIPVFHF